MKKKEHNNFKTFAIGGIKHPRMERNLVASFIFFHIKSKEGKVGKSEFFKGLVPFDSFSSVMEEGHGVMMGGGGKRKRSFCII